MADKKAEAGFYVSHETAVNIALSMYVGDPCQLCGQSLTREDLKTAIWAGSAPAHKECWDTRKRKDDS